MVGTLKARVGGVWVPVAGSGMEAANLARWNTAWGVVGTGTISFTADQVPPANSTEVTSRINYVLLTTRRYELRFQCAIYGGAVNFGLFSGGAYTGGSAWFTGAAGTWGTEQWIMPFIGSGFNQAYSIGIASTQGSPHISNATAHFELHDMGPVTLAAIAPPEATLPVVASGNALGIIVRGSLLPSPNPISIAANVQTSLTNAMVVTLAVGRRYRIVFVSRAMSATAATGPQFFLWDNGASTIGAMGDRYVWIGGSYQQALTEWHCDGDGGVHSFIVRCQPAGAIAIYVDYGQFYVEDMGPNSAPALPVPATPPAWTDATLQNGWVPMDAPNAGARTPRYRKIGDEVSLTGAMKSGSPGVAALNLPAGFRPITAAKGFLVDANNNVGTIEVYTNGNVVHQGGSNAYVYLDQVRFSISG